MSDEPIFHVNTFTEKDDTAVLNIVTENIERDPDGHAICAVYIDDELIYQNLKEE